MNKSILIREVKIGSESLSENEVLFAFPKDKDVRINTIRAKEEYAMLSSFSGNDLIIGYAVQVDKVANIKELIAILNQAEGADYRVSEYANTWHFAKLCNYSTIHALPIEYGYKASEDLSNEVQSFVLNEDLTSIFLTADGLSDKGPWMIIEAFMPKHTFLAISAESKVKEMLFNSGKFASSFPLIKKGAVEDFNLRRYCVKLVLSFYFIYNDMREKKGDGEVLFLTDDWSPQQVHNIELPEWAKE